MTANLSVLSKYRKDGWPTLDGVITSSRLPHHHDHDGQTISRSTTTRGRLQCFNHVCCAMCRFNVRRHAGFKLLLVALLGAGHSLRAVVAQANVGLTSSSILQLTCVTFPESTDTSSGPGYQGSCNVTGSLPSGATLLGISVGPAVQVSGTSSIPGVASMRR